MHHRDERFKQGVYKPVNNKYTGKSYPKYRSSWELKFFRWCDLNQNVVSWNSENVIIPYRIGNGKPRRYIVDNTVVTKFIVSKWERTMPVSVVPATLGTVMSMEWIWWHLVVTGTIFGHNIFRLRRI